MQIRKRKKPTVQLTSLLDLLFIMIFISLIQSKEMPTMGEIEDMQQEISQKTDSDARPQEEVTPTVQNINATFHFHPTSQNPQLPEGTFSMLGTFNKETRVLNLGGINWIDRPEGYDMVPLSGEINSTGSQFEGRIEFPGCEVFTLQRDTEASADKLSGTWSGTYICSQGETGLKLTIH